MSCRTVVAAVLIAGGGLLSASGLASAEPIQIRSGVLSLDSGPSGFRLLTDEFSVLFADWAIDVDATADVFGPYRDCFVGTCVPGMTFDPGMAVSSMTLGSGPATYQGTSYDSLFFSGSMVATAAPGVVPDMGAAFRVQTFHPFDFTGSLLAFTTPDRSGDPLFAFDLVGQGHVGVWWQLHPGVRMHSYELFYLMGAADPIPEPGTLLLVGTGVLLGWRRARRGRARPERH